MLTDLFWTVATSDPVLMLTGGIALAALVVTHVPLIRFIPTIDDYLRIAAAVGYLALFLFGLFLGARIADERAETQHLKGELQWSTNQLEQQKATAEDAERLRLVAQQSAGELQKKVDDYEAELAKRPPGAPCSLTADDLRRLRDIDR